MQNRFMLSWEGSVDVARRELVARKRTLLLRVALMASVLFVATLLILGVISGNERGHINPYTGVTEEQVRSASESAGTALMMVYYCLLGLFAMLSASAMFPELADREKRIQFLMMPESTADKFAGRMIVYGPLFFAAYVVCAGVALVLGMLIGRVIYEPLFDLSKVGNPMEVVFGSEHMGLIVWPAIVLLIADVSFYVTGSVAFPRRTFIKTFALLTVAKIVIQGAIGLLGVTGLGMFLLPSMLLGFAAKPYVLELGCWIVCGSAMLLTLFNWIMGYVWLRATDVIDE